MGVPLRTSCKSTIADGVPWEARLSKLWQRKKSLSKSFCKVGVSFID